MAGKAVATAAFWGARINYPETNGSPSLSCTRLGSRRSIFHLARGFLFRENSSPARQDNKPRRRRIFTRRRWSLSLPLVDGGDSRPLVSRLTHLVVGESRHYLYIIRFYSAIRRDRGQAPWLVRPRFTCAKRPYPEDLSNARQIVKQSPVHGTRRIFPFPACWPERTSPRRMRRSASAV